MKYVMFKRKLGKGKDSGVVQFIPVIFPNQLVHADVAEALMEGGPLDGCTVHSAGEWTGMAAVGGSETLKIKSDPADTRRILLNDYGMAFE